MSTVEDQLSLELETVNKDILLKKALLHYKDAIKSEREGNLGESLNKYRLAHKVHEDVESIYRRLERLQLCKRNEEEEMLNSDASEAMLTVSSVPSPTLTENESVNESVVPNILKLPDEVLLVILENCIRDLHDLRYLSSIALTCKHFAKALRADSLYRSFCYCSCEQKEWQQSIKSIEEELVEKYQQSWKTLFLKKPRSRFDGCYISVCRYFRPGTSDTSWNQPIHLITYYRYLRLYPNSTCIVYQSSNEPNDVVRNFSVQNTSLFSPMSSSPMFSNGNVALTGSWSMTPSGEMLIVYPASQTYTYVQKLQVRGIRLKWISFYSIHNYTSFTNEMPLTHNRDYVFSRVYSYTADSESLKRG
ncbi:F-box protein Pof7 [Schizosaccharomyces pombe]|uniref:F-box protein pof7 n=1 Tax=Schizosaccharomyces pombe (strain 972 / ATCC 24843) TaxID=284812 RepID=POF7_SCHPO|nr:F-box protein Pof7 [Schizosaccharomyces pombe]O74531.2 RecName: Full=F-box protein pof7 [Schizosaccharomyces pombe 972h-]CAA19361.2 F-box protein Pof7 [Schizosaccharomyces pombe]|eukprot:NP_588546.2 F-box protein Pof7 [Schizosaccharomyces pombe]